MTLTEETQTQTNQTRTRFKYSPYNTELKIVTDLN
jgi:hypothetical protein